MRAEGKTADPRLSDERWRAALAECLALYRVVTGDVSQSRPLQPTDALAFGPYTVVGLLGQGGMGRVYSARAADGSRVAIKALIAYAAARDAALPRFQRELAAARRIEGRLTARVVDADLEADPPWLATEYIQGPTLTTVVGALGPLPPPVVCALAVGIASALRDIHAAGVVHRDLKPSNILLAPDGLRVVDFGIARTADGTTLTGPGWTLGTPAFMAPEQVVGQPVEAPADVFALGSVLVYAATGEPPFGVDEATTVMYRTVHDAPALAGVAEPLRGVVESCLGKDPASRPAPAEVIERTLDLLGHVPARPDPARESVHAATTVITAVVDPADGPARDSATHGEPTQDNPVVPDPTAGDDAEAGEHPQAPAGDGPALSAPTGARRSAPGGKRRRVVVGTALGAVFVVSATLTALAASHRNGSPAHSGNQLSLGTGASHPPAAKSSAPRTPVRSTSAAGSATATLPGTFLAGPGCAASPWADTTRALPGQDQFVANVTGGDPECGGVAAAFRKSGSTAPSASGFTWEFHLGRAARCTLSIYIADIDSSSGVALYQVTTARTSVQFQVSQAQAKGQWVRPPAVGGLTPADGVVRLRLTDAGAFVGDNFHVTASAVRAACS